MSVQDIDTWVRERLRTQDGGWDPNTLMCIEYGMENRQPVCTVTQSAIIPNWNALDEYWQLFCHAVDYVRMDKTALNTRRREIEFVRRGLDDDLSHLNRRLEWNQSLVQEKILDAAIKMVTLCLLIWQEVVGYSPAVDGVV